MFYTNQRIKYNIYYQIQYTPVVDIWKTRAQEKQFILFIII